LATDSGEHTKTKKLAKQQKSKFEDHHFFFPVNPCGFSLTGKFPVSKFNNYCRLVEHQKMLCGPNSAFQNTPFRRVSKQEAIF